MPAATAVGRTFAPTTGRPSRSAIVPSIGTSSRASRSTAGLPEVPSPRSLHAGANPSASAITWTRPRIAAQSGIAGTSERVTANVNRPSAPVVARGCRDAFSSARGVT